MKLFALDLSLTCTGYALSDGTVGRLRCPESVGTSVKRLKWIRDQVVGLAKAQRTELGVLEGYSFASEHSRAHALGELGGVVRLGLFEAGITFAVVPPSSLKQYATGNGGAKKDAVTAEAIRQLGYQGSSNDEADALWLREMAIARYSAKYDASAVPNKRKNDTLDVIRRRALAGVEWPVIQPTRSEFEANSCAWKTRGTQSPGAAADALFFP